MEVWKDVIWFEWYYLVSNLWRVMSLNYNSIKWYKKILKQMPHWRDKNYRIINLRKPWYRKMYLVHRIVADAFIPNIEDKPQINHKDWNASNNNVVNLEWCNNSENVIHSYNILLRKPTPWQRYWKNATAKAILQFTIDNKFVQEFDSIKRANNYFGKEKTNIWMVLNWYRKKAEWYIRRYK